MYTYDPYGNVTPDGGNSVANPWQYTGGYLDSQTELVKLGQRFDDPSTGRWTQRDPVPQGNRYVYAGDNPINFVDPSGTSAFTSLVKQTAGEFLLVDAVLALVVPEAAPALVPGAVFATEAYIAADIVERISG